MNSGLIVEDCCVAFIDILGFKEMTNSIEKIREFADIINDAIDIMKNFDVKAEAFTNIQNSPSIITVQGADSIFFMFPKEFLYIFVVIRRLSIMQLKLASKGIYIRGSVNSGCTYLDKSNNVYFGDAWNKAVASESKAGVPRIILENCIVKLIEDRLKAINESVGEFLLDNDGSYVLSSFGIHSLLALTKTQKEAENLYSDIFDRLKKAVIRNKESKSILQKYLWLAKQVEKEQNGEIKRKAKEVYEYIQSLIKQL